MIFLFIYYLIGIFVAAIIGWKRYNILMIHLVYLLIILLSAIYWPVLLKEYRNEQST